MLIQAGPAHDAIEADLGNRVQQHRRRCRLVADDHGGVHSAVPEQQLVADEPQVTIEQRLPADEDIVQLIRRACLSQLPRSRAGLLRRLGRTSEEFHCQGDRQHGADHEAIGLGDRHQAHRKLATPRISPYTAASADSRSRPNIGHRATYADARGGVRESWAVLHRASMPCAIFVGRALRMAPAPVRAPLILSPTARGVAVLATAHAPRTRRSFARLNKVLEVPNLIDIQRRSFDLADRPEAAVCERRSMTSRRSRTTPATSPSSSASSSSTSRSRASTSAARRTSPTRAR